MTLGLVVFDVDGTLVDSQAHILASMAGAFAALGREAPGRAETLSIVGLSLPVAMARLAPDAPAGDLEALVEAYKATFMSIRVSGEDASPLYPGTRVMLDGLSVKPDLLLGLATGKSRRGLQHLVEAHGLATYFATQQVADDHPSKPHPSMLHACLSEAGAGAGRAVMVGDTEFDIEMGRAAGFCTVGVTWGYHGLERLAAADRLISNWSELPGVLAELGIAA
jgi:phosphoglycolate phosphatase